MKPLTDDQLTLTAARLRAIADELTAPHAPQVQTLIADEADPTPWPTSTSAAGSGSPSSPVEAASSAPTRPNQRHAATLASDLRQLAKLAQHVDIGLQQRSPLRVIARCANPTCNAPLRPDKRCPECSTREGTKMACGDCGLEPDRRGLRPWPPKGWTGWADGVDRVLCWKDYKWRHRHDGRPAIGVTRLALRDAPEIESEATAAG